MRTAEEETKFTVSLDLWVAAALAHQKARECCRVAHAKATSESNATGVAKIKAEADASTTDHRATRDELEVLERAAYHSMIFHRGIHGEGSTV